MNFSAPISFQTSFNFPHGYYSSPNNFPQPSGPSSTYRLNPTDNIRQVPDSLYNKFWANEDEVLAYEPIKKVKVPYGYDADFASSQSKLLNCMQRSETINKANEMTSSINPRLQNRANFFDERLNLINRQGPSQALILANDPQELIALQNANGLPFNLKSLYGYENPQNVRAPMQQQFNQIRSQEQAMAFSQGYPGPQSQQQLSMEAQLNLLQNLQQQINSSQKAYEQLLINNANPMLQNSMLLNAQTLNAIKQAQNEQQRQEQQRQEQQRQEQQRQEMALLQNAQNRLLLEQEAQRRYAELVMAKNMTNQNAQFIQGSRKISEQIDFSEFPELQFDLSALPDFYLPEGEGFELRYDNIEDQKMRVMEDFDDKRTAETSASADEMAMKEFYDSQLLEFQTQIIQQQIAAEKRLLESSKVTPNKNKQVVAQESILKKRQLVFEEVEEKKPIVARKSPKKNVELEQRSRNISLVQVPEPISSQSSVSPVKDDQFMSPTGQFELIKDAEFTMKKVGRPKKEKVKSVQQVQYFEVKQQIPRERKMNRLQSIRAAQDNYMEELKKPYVIKLHVDASDPEQKVALTNVGEGYQVRPEVLNVNNQTKRQPRLIKSVWNPSSIEEVKLEEFYGKLREIFGQDVKSEEAALKLLRGAGMDVDGIVDIVRRNADYFKTMLFPEPKPAKIQRF